MTKRRIKRTCLRVVGLILVGVILVVGVIAAVSVGLGQLLVKGAKWLEIEANQCAD